MSELVHVSVAGSSQSATRLDVSVRGFEFVVDEPESLGGTDVGPNPVEYVLAGYAGCMNVVLRMVAAEQGVALRGLRVKAEGELDPARLMGKPTQNRAGFAWIRLVAEVDSDASAEQIDEVLRIAETRCPVGDNLSTATPLELVRASAGTEAPVRA